MEIIGTKDNYQEFTELVETLSNDREEALQQILASAKKSNRIHNSKHRDIEPIPTRVRAGLARVG